MSDLLANVRTEGSPVSPFGTSSDERESTPAAPPAEDGGTEEAPARGGADDGTTQEETAPSDNSRGEENLPFNKHPRWREMQKRNKDYEDENKTLRSTVEQLARQQQEFFQRLTPPAPQQEASKAPDWFVQAYGDDPNAWSVYEKAMAHQREQLKADLSKEAERERAAQAERSQAQARWVEDSIKAVEKAHGVDFAKDRDLMNRVLSFALEFKPTDDEGNISLVHAYAMYKRLHPDQPDQAAAAKKRIASETLERGKGGSDSPRDFFTSKDLRSGWKGIASS